MTQTIKRASIVIAAGFLAAGFLTASTVLAESPASQPKGGTVKGSEAPAEHITVQHILIGFQGSVGSKPITRSRAEAKTLADDVLARARKGEDFDALVKQYTDDSAPGIYGMANDGVAPTAGERPRKGMVKGFGDVGFSLKVGEIGMAEHDIKSSPFGWHIVKRIK